MPFLRLVIEPLTPFATSLLGDTLFGQLCWEVRNTLGERRLAALLDGYLDGRPFAVLSDAFPSGCLPRPLLPAGYVSNSDVLDRKALKKRLWLPLASFHNPLQDWPEVAWTQADLAEPQNGRTHAWSARRAQPRNTLSRLTGTTGEDGFAPYTVSQTWYRPGARLDIYAILDERISAEEFGEVMTMMGESGFGRDASTGLGKFQVAMREACQPLVQPNADTFLTLAPCAPQGCGFDATRSFYQVFTRFGRHGSMAAVQGQPFKNPVLLARTGAVLTPRIFKTRLFVGRGLGGEGRLSKTLSDTVHQGYAPVAAVRLPASQEATR